MEPETISMQLYLQTPTAIKICMTFMELTGKRNMETNANICIQSFEDEWHTNDQCKDTKWLDTKLMVLVKLEKGKTGQGRHVLKVWT